MSARGLSKTTDERLAGLQGQIIALTYFVRSILASNEIAGTIAAEAQVNLEQMKSAFVALPFPDDIFQGIDYAMNAVLGREHQANPRQVPS